MTDRFAARYARPGFGPWARTALPSVVCAAALAVLAVGAAPAWPRRRSAASCQPYSGKPCLFPFPDNRLTRRRPHQRHQAARQPPGGGDAGQHQGRARSGPRAWNRNDGFSPGSAIVLHVPGLDNAAALKRTGVGPHHQHRRSRWPSASRSCSSTRPPARASSSGPSSTRWPRARQHRPDDPPGQAPGRGPHLHRRAAQPAHEVRARSSRRRSGSRCLRDGGKLPKAERPQTARYAAIFKALKRAGIAPQQEPVRGVELHRRLAPEPDRAACWRSATTPSRSSATPTSPTRSTPATRRRSR